jgi:hypothetical protein
MLYLFIPQKLDKIGRLTKGIDEPMPTQSPHPVEIALMTLLGVVALCGLSGSVLTLVPPSTPGETNIALLPLTLSLVFASITSIGMIWRRNRRTPALIWAVAGIVLWFVGVNLLGLGGVSVLLPGDYTFAENLGFSLALCLAPGAIVTLLGLGLYSYDYRQGQRSVGPLSVQAQRRAGKLKRAAEYRRQITRLIQQHSNSFLAAELAPLIDRLEQWEARLRQLSHKLDAFEANSLIQQDLRELPEAINHLQTQLEREPDAHLQTEMSQTLVRHQQHQAHLNSLVTLMRQTELEIDETLATLGAIYSQLHLVGTKATDNQHVSALSADVEEQRQRLGDLLAAMDEVYGSSTDLK